MNSRLKKPGLPILLALMLSLGLVSGTVAAAQLPVAVSEPGRAELSPCAATSSTVAIVKALSVEADPLQTLQTELPALAGKYGVHSGIMVKDNRSGAGSEVRADDLFVTGSVYKVFVLWKVQMEISAGRLSDDTQLPVVAYSEDDGSSGGDSRHIPYAGIKPENTARSIRLYNTGDGGTISVAEARRMMILYSDNTAAWTLGTAVGWFNIDGMLREHNFSATTIAQPDPVTTAREMVKFYEGLVNQTLDPTLRPGDYALMLDLMKNHVYNTLIKAGFPASAVFASKPGFIGGVLNDTGALFTPDGRVIFIVVLTEGDPGAGKALMADVGRLVWRTLGQNSIPRFFPETKQTVSGKFLEYWQNNGGLTVFGYPISEARQEKNVATGQSVLTQWFERSRLELHPEKAGTPYEVLRGLLGTELCAKALKTDTRFLPTKAIQDTVNPGAHRYFQETQHNLSWGFMTYWQNNGGLNRFGYPISEEHLELDPETGKTYLVQWFERARFEYHPEKKGTPYEVMLSLLGKQGMGR